jgi:hypothetical protein
MAFDLSTGALIVYLWSALSLYLGINEADRGSESITELASLVDTGSALMERP